MVGIVGDQPKMKMILLEIKISHEKQKLFCSKYKNYSTQITYQASRTLYFVSDITAVVSLLCV